MPARAAVSPGGALLRTSRMFSVPKPLPDIFDGLNTNKDRAQVITTPYPQYQSITSPLSSREKGDWGFKRPFPPRTTMTTSTPYISVKEVDTSESVTDFQSAANHTLSREKFQELGVAMSVPVQSEARRGIISRNESTSRSVFEEEDDVTAVETRAKSTGRWKFRGPWLGNMPEGDFLEYLEKIVRPRRKDFTEALRQKLAQDMTAQQNRVAQDKGEEKPRQIETGDITPTQFSDYLRSLRHDRVTLNAIVTKFLDLAPLGTPVGIIQTFWGGQSGDTKDSPYNKSGPPPSHPSAGISYLRTSAFVDNHPVYGPQARKSPTLARVVVPRSGSVSAKMGVGGFVADAPSGDNEFNVRHSRNASGARKSELRGITHLDTTTYGGAKAYVEPRLASVDSNGWVHLKLREASAEGQVLAKEARGKAKVYSGTKTSTKNRNQSSAGSVKDKKSSERLDRVSDEILGDATVNNDATPAMSSSDTYGLGLSR